MLYLGIVAALAAGNALANARGLSGARVYLASVLLAFPALLGGRLAYVAAHWSAYRIDPHRIWRRSDGGQVTYGALLAVPVSVPLLAALGLPFALFWDIGACSLLAAMVFTRVGCVLNGCCAGRPTESRFGLTLAGVHGVRARRVPTQLLEAGVAAVLLASSAVLVLRHAPPGTVFAGALAAYALGRLVLDAMRERQRRVAGVPALRAVAAVLLAVALWSLLPRVL